MTKRDELDEVTDLLTSVLGNAESYFQSRNRGVGGLVMLRDDVAFTWEKQGPRWGLFVNREPVRTASREFRMLAAAKLPDLLRQLEMNEGTMLDRLKESLRHAETFLRVRRQEDECLAKDVQSEDKP
jgi:hypothetical protein